MPFRTVAPTGPVGLSPPLCWAEKPLAGQSGQPDAVCARAASGISASARARMVLSFMIVLLNSKVTLCGISGERGRGAGRAGARRRRARDRGVRGAPAGGGRRGRWRKKRGRGRSPRHGGGEGNGKGGGGVGLLRGLRDPAAAGSVQRVPARRRRHAAGTSLPRHRLARVAAHEQRSSRDRHDPGEHAKRDIECEQPPFHIKFIPRRLIPHAARGPSVRRPPFPAPPRGTNSGRRPRRPASRRRRGRRAFARRGPW